MPARPKRPELPARTAKLFRNGRNQALRIPRDFEFAVSEVVIYKDDDRIITSEIRDRDAIVGSIKDFLSKGK